MCFTHRNKGAFRLSGKFRNLHQDEIGWLIGNGPSVCLDDLEALDEAVCFGANRIHLAYQKTSWRPDYVVSVDEQVIRDFGSEIDLNNDGHVFLVSKKLPLFQSTSTTWLPSVGATPLKFRQEISKGVTPGGGSLIGALQIGFFMGIKHFFLYGVDHDFSYSLTNSDDILESAAGEGNHFIENYRGNKPWQKPVEWQAESSFLMSHIFLQSQGGFLMNATRGGKLDTLPRIDFPEALELSRLNRELTT